MHVILKSVKTIKCRNDLHTAQLGLLKLFLTIVTQKKVKYCYTKIVMIYSWVFSR